MVRQIEACLRLPVKHHTKCSYGKMGAQRASGVWCTIDNLKTEERAHPSGEIIFNCGTANAKIMNRQMEESGFYGVDFWVFDLRVYQVPSLQAYCREAD